MSDLAEDYGRAKVLARLPPPLPVSSSLLPYAHLQSTADLFANDTAVREIIAMRARALSLHQIAARTGVPYRTLLDSQPEFSRYINDETRALAQGWQGDEFARLELISQRFLRELLPYTDDVNDPDYVPLESRRPPNQDYANAYARLVITKMTVLTLQSGKAALPEPPQYVNNEAEIKADDVVQFRDLSAKLMLNMQDSGVGGGDEFDAEEEEDLDAWGHRADNSDTIADAVVLDTAAFTDDDLDSRPGQWIDGKFVPQAEENN